MRGYSLLEWKQIGMHEGSVVTGWGVPKPEPPADPAIFESAHAACYVDRA
jgi:hypothetical protein